MEEYSTLIAPTPPTTPPGRIPLRCCSDHAALLADLEVDAIGDPDVARLLPRIRYLLAGSTHLQSQEVPWWVR